MKWHGIVFVVVMVGCQRGKQPLQHRDRAEQRDEQCVDPALPNAFFYPAKNRTDYAPDHPDRDGCKVLVPDHLFCCPDVARSTDQ